MPEARYGEGLLELFTTPDRAAAIVGDLLEESRGRGPVWRALQLIRIAWWLLLESIRSEPVRCLGLGGVSLVVWASAYAAFFTASGLPWYPWHRVNEPEFWIRAVLFVTAANLATGFVVGRWIAFRGTNGLGPLIALLLAGGLGYWAGYVLLHPEHWWLHVARLVALMLTFPIFYLAPLLAGGTLAQRRQCG